MLFAAFGSWNLPFCMPFVFLSGQPQCYYNNGVKLHNLPLKLSALLNQRYRSQYDVHGT